MNDPSGTLTNPSTTEIDMSRIYALPTVTTSSNAGPITPGAALPSDCLSSLWDFQTPGLLPYNPFSWTYYTVGCAVSSCCPGTQPPFSTGYEWLTTYHSPAVCPAGHKTCPGPSVLTPTSGETLAFCCPSKYTPISAGIVHLERVADNGNEVKAPLVVLAAGVSTTNGLHVKATWLRPPQRSSWTTSKTSGPWELRT